MGSFKSSPLVFFWERRREIRSQTVLKRIQTVARWRSPLTSAATRGQTDQLPSTTRSTAAAWMRGRHPHRTGWKGMKFSKRRAWIQLWEDAFPPHTSCSLDLLILIFYFYVLLIYFSKLFSGDREDAPTSHSDSLCLVFLRLPRRLHQVRRFHIFKSDVPIICKDLT